MTWNVRTVGFGCVRMSGRMGSAGAIHRMPIGDGRTQVTMNGAVNTRAKNRRRGGWANLAISEGFVICETLYNE